MKKFLRLTPLLWLWLLPLLVVAGPKLPAADSPLGGQWRGNLKVPGGAWEMVVTIIPLSNGTLYATLDVPKQKISRMPVKAELKGREVTMRIEEAGSKFSGQLAADGKSISGTWTQPALSEQLTLERTSGSVINAATFKPSLPYREEEVVVPNKIAKLRLTGTLTMGRKNRLQVAQKRRFTATTLAAKRNVATRLYLKRNSIQRGRVAPRIMKRYILESELRHTKISLALINVGKNSNTQ